MSVFLAGYPSVMVRLSLSIFLHSQSASISLTDTLPVDWIRETSRRVVIRRGHTLELGTLCQPIKALTPLIDSLQLASSEKFLICRLIPVELSVWGPVPVVSFQQGTGHTVLVILTFRSTGALENSTSGQGLVCIENQHHRYRMAVHQELNQGPEQAGLLSQHREPQGAGWQSVSHLQLQQA